MVDLVASRSQNQCVKMRGDALKKATDFFEAYSSLGALSFNEYEVVLRFLKDTELPVYKGSTIRGAWMWQCAKMLCVCRDQSTQKDKQHDDGCSYARIFELPKNAQKKKNGLQVKSLPFLLKTPRSRRRFFVEGDCLSFGFLLSGDLEELFPLMLFALQEAGIIGVGGGLDRGMGRFVVDTVFSVKRRERVQIFSNSDPNLPISTGANFLHELKKPSLDSLHRVHLDFLTPLRCQRRGGIEQKEISLAMLLRLVTRRLRLLSESHLGHRIDIEAKELFEMLRGVEIEDRHFYWYDLERYSASQKQKVGLGGLRGHITLDRVPAIILWLLQLCEPFHLGKSTSSGLGQYRLELLPPSNRTNRKIRGSRN